MELIQELGQKLSKEQIAQIENEADKILNTYASWAWLKAAYELGHTYRFTGIMQKYRETYVDKRTWETT